MIIEYHRPNNLQEVLSLLARESPKSYALGGGTILNQFIDEDIAVVDLQEVGLGKITTKGNILQIGATVTLQELLEYEGLPEEFYQVIKHEASYNLRQMATIAGTVVSASGRSPFTTALLAMDASLETQEVDKEPIIDKLGDWLPMRGNDNRGKLITLLSIPANIRFAYEYIARSPADRPIICTGVCKWGSGRTRLALGGFGKAPILAMDGPISDGIDIAGREAYSIAGDQWASAEYRQEMAGILALRCLNRLGE